MPSLETARLVIRPFLMTDLDVCHRLLDMDAWQTGRSREQRRVWLEWAVLNYEALAELNQPPYGDRAVTLRSTGEVVGAVGLVPSFGPFARLPSLGGDVRAVQNQPQVGLFWATLSEHRGQGYATEAARGLIAYAFDVLRLRRLVATTEHDSHASQAVMRRLGMSVETNPLREPPWFQCVGVLFAP